MIRGFLALVVRIFFRRVEVLGAEHVPATGPVLLVLNHPNSLVDPLFLLALAPRRTVFLAKEPLFHIPIVGMLARAMGSIPVYRKMDGADTAMNRRTFEKVWEVLGNGGAIALFPEGTSHNDPMLRPLKTGAARMALGAASVHSGTSVRIVPGGLYYTAKGRFRSSALLSFGAPISVRSVTLDAEGEPPADDVRALTSRIQDALSDVTVQADREEAVRLIARAERILSSTTGPIASDGDLARQFELRQRLQRGYLALRERVPDQIAAIESRLNRYDASLAAAGLAPEDLLRSRLTVRAVLQTAMRSLLTLMLLAIPAAVGLIVHFLPYKLLIPMLTRAARPEHDVLSTTKILASAAVFPLLWIAALVLVGLRWGWPAGIAAFFALPLTGYAALLFVERLDRLVGSARGLSLRLLRPTAFQRLETERREIAAALEALEALI